MSKLQIVRGADLDKAIATELTLYQAIGERLHGLAISAIVMVCEHGQTGPLNRLFDGLRPNDKQAMQLYLRRIQVVNGLGGDDPDGLISEEIKAAEKAGAIVSRKDKKFVAIVGRNAQRKSLAKLCEDRFLNPEGDDKMIFDRHNMAEVRVMGAVEFLDKIIRAGAEIEEGDTDKREIHLTASDREFILKLSGMAEQRKNQLALLGKTPKTTPAPHVIKTKAPKTAKTGKVQSLN